MALTNILREPRREITETVVGLAIIVPIVYLDYRFALWFEEATGPDKSCPWPIGMMFGVMIAILIVMGAVAIHILGTGICNWLENNGIQMRPRQRFGQGR